MKAWYVAYTKSRGEFWARANLWQRGFEVYLPIYQKTRRHARRQETIAAPLFPRYLFVEADMAAGDRRRLSSAPGVDSLVCFGNRPAELPPSALAEIRGREDEAGYVVLSPPSRFRTGEPVEIVNGALGSFAGLFEREVDSHRVFVLLQLLGRQVRVTVPVNRLALRD